jgi:hypothetical protein
METKDELISKITEWIQLDNQIKEKEKIVKKLKQDKKKISELLIETMKKNQIDCVNLSENSLLFKKQTVKQNINKKLLNQCLLEYYNNNTDKAIEISDFILNKRVEKTIELIKRKPI